MKIRKDFTDEKECQEYYEETLFPMCAIYTKLDMNTDGRFQGNLFEFKYPLKSLSKSLFQCIKYLSNFRLRGIEVPSQIYIIDGKKAIVYKYNSEQFHNEIQMIYNGAASKDNEKFYSNINPDRKYDLEDDFIREEFINEIKENKTYHKIDIDENCILGWAQRFYNENKNATKDELLGDGGELRNPNYFKDFINSYKGKSNEKFKYIMDVLNDKHKQKKLGAFYTPALYCEKAAELVRDAISKVPNGYDYIILDRCAGTGNLEAVLTDEELSHCVLNTYEYYEYLVLKERLGNKVRAILPVDENGNEAPIEIDSNGLIITNNAMEKDFIENKYLESYIKNDKCIIILYENPPYSDSATINGSSKSSIQESFIGNELKEKIGGYEPRELANQFIYSGFQYYLKDNFLNSYILFSPIKYWKTSEKIVKKDFNKGFIFNRQHFHATPSAITCLCFNGANSDIKELKDIEIYDIEKDNSLKYQKSISIKRVFKPASTYYDKTIFEDDITTSTKCGCNGYPTNKKAPIKPIYNKNIIGCACLTSFTNDFNNVYLVRTNLVHGNNGSMTHIRKNNYLNILPSICSKLQFANSTNWWDDIFYSSADGERKYQNDYEFLKSCFIYISLSQYNKCISFKSSENIDYFNELCFDNRSNHEPQALKDFKVIVLDENGKSEPITDNTTESIIEVDKNGNKKLKFKPFQLNNIEKELLGLWNRILDEIINHKNYDPNKSYGLYQIIQEINTFHIDNENNKIPDNIILNDNITLLKQKLKEYYKEYIEPKCFQYELLK